jgi:DAK2 domain fusion protein YloV
MNAQEFIRHFKAASNYLESLKDDVNKLNVFPVPDGDTGTNMSLTFNSVVKELEALPPGVGLIELRKAITHGSLMGARGNSGVITSQILRGFCEGLEGADSLSTHTLAVALAKSVEVSYAAVRKPVEGTILTVVSDVAKAVARADEAQFDTNATLRALVDEAFLSVQRTPDLLPVLKESGVVDAGGYGLAVLIQGFVASVLNETVGEARITGVIAEIQVIEFGSSGDSAAAISTIPQVAIEQIDDWDDSEFLYCTEFLLSSELIDVDEALEYLASIGDCELLVGSHPDFKVHVHTDSPGEVLNYMLERGQVIDVHVHNMLLQAAERSSMLGAGATGASGAGVTGASGAGTAGASGNTGNGSIEAANLAGSDSIRVATAHPKKRGYIAVASGSGLQLILESLGVDVIVSGGQTMNPSTAELLEAIDSVNSEEVIVFPNNKNIIMAAQAAADVSDKKVAVVPTRSVPESFSALFVADENQSLDDEVEYMIEAASEVRAAEITHAIKEAISAHGDQIKAGDVIGVYDGAIEIVGADVSSVALKMIEHISDDNHDTLTLLAGEQLDQDEFELLVAEVEDTFPNLEVDARRGDQPLYPLIMAAE